MARDFRTQDSYEIEQSSRGVLLKFLESQGFTHVEDRRTPHGPAQSRATSSSMMDAVK